MTRRIGLLALLALVLVPASASAAPRSAAAAKLVDCDPEAASATFESVMRTVPGTTGMAVKFVLQARDAGGRWARVDAPGFGRWINARSGKTRFVYDKTITKLPAPGEYRVVVGFRWRDATGTLDRTSRRSPACEQPDPRPDLRPVALERTSSGWVLTVVNAGGTATTAVPASLSVAGGPELRRPIAPIEPGDDTGVYFDGVTCAPGQTLTATVDPDEDLDEADESGNGITVACPAAS